VIHYAGGVFFEASELVIPAPEFLRPTLQLRGHALLSATSILNQSLLSILAGLVPSAKCFVITLLLLSSLLLLGMMDVADNEGRHGHHPPLPL
jgi:hypothetical protein